MSCQTQLISPYGGRLVDRRVPADEQRAWREQAAELPSLTVTGRALAWLDLLAAGALSPVDHLFRREEFVAVKADSRLPDGTPFPWPIALRLHERDALAAGPGDSLALRGPTRELLAVLEISDVFADDDGWWLGGLPHVLGRSKHHDFAALRTPPAEVRAALAELGREAVIAIQPTRILHQDDAERLAEAAARLNASLLIQLPVGLTRLGELEPFARLTAARHAAPGAVLQVVPDLPRDDPARDALGRAILARNAGASHLVLEGEAVDLSPVGVEPLRWDEPASGEYDPAVAALVAAACPPRERGGLCVWFTGLPSAGKSTIAEELVTLLLEQGREVTVLDGDVVRTHLSQGLGFSKEDRDINIRRIGFVAAEIARHQGTAVVAAVSPYEATREQVREMVGPARFVLVHVATPVGVCEQRDAKGMYAMARQGRIHAFTGVDDPYEVPARPELTLDTVAHTPAENARQVLDWLVGHGLVAAREEA